MTVTSMDKKGTGTSTKNNTGSFAILATLFFIWGFITSLNDILIPYLKHNFVLSYFKAMLVQFAFFGAYFIGSVIYFLSSMFYGDLISRIGYKNCIVAGLLVASFSCCLFYPAAHYQAYGVFLAALFFLGIGFTLLQIAANPYVIVLGAEKSASSRLNLAQAINSLGTTVAPLLGGWLLFGAAGNQSVPGPAVIQDMYAAFAVVFIGLAVVFKWVRLPAVVNETTVVKGAGALRHSNLLMGIAAIFVYVGAEVCIGSFLIGFLKLPRNGSIPESAGSKYVAIYWGGLMAGRFIGTISLGSMRKTKQRVLMAVIPASILIVFFMFFSFRDTLYAAFFLLLNLAAFFAGQNLPARTLGIFSVILVILVLVAVTCQGAAAKWSLVAAGLFNSICWSNIFSLSLKSLGKYTSQGSSLLVMAILGAAVIPLVQGLVADATGLQYSFLIPALCYLYLVWYGFNRYYKIEKGAIAVTGTT